MIELDEQEKLVVRELIKDPRLSDNQISKQTRVPVMTVNRKRKALEQKGLLNYFCYLDTSRYGTGALPARQLYIIKFKIGITKQELLEKLLSDPLTKTFFTSHEYESHLGEKDGSLVWATILEGGKGNEIVEVFNGHIVNFIRKYFGEDSIIELYVVRLTTQFRLFHNYLPLINMENGKIKKKYPSENLFVE